VGFFGLLKAAWKKQLKGYADQDCEVAVQDRVPAHGQGGPGVLVAGAASSQGRGLSILVQYSTVIIHITVNNIYGTGTGNL
jgi:hypothetical protein